MARDSAVEREGQWRGVTRVPLATHLGRAASPGIRVAFAALRSISKFVSSRLIWAGLDIADRAVEIIAEGPGGGGHGDQCT